MDNAHGPVVPKSRILPLAAAVTALTLGASPAQAAQLSPGKRDEAKVVAFPLLAVKGQEPASVGYHVSHSSIPCVGHGRARLACFSCFARLVGPWPAPTSAAPVASQPPPPVEPGPGRQRGHGWVVGRRAVVGQPGGQPGGRWERQPGHELAGAARSSSSHRSLPSRAGSGGSPAGEGAMSPAGGALGAGAEAMVTARSAPRRSRWLLTRRRWTWTRCSGAHTRWPPR